MQEVHAIKQPASKQSGRSVCKHLGVLPSARYVVSPSLGAAACGRKGEGLLVTKLLNQKIER